MAMASSRNETASFSSSFTYRSPSSPPPSPPSPNSSVNKGNSSITVTKKHHRNSNNDAVTSPPSSSSSSQKRSCMCSPTTHPGSFRCAYHRRIIMEQQQNLTASLRHSSNGTSSRLNLGKSAMQNSLVKIEGEILRNPLTIFISSSSQQPRRRETFQLRLTRLSVMSKTQDS
ncbi:PREDICTED: uncharacterized protein LOC109351162 isoform X2 [Lupinus angustifolius]|uniref:uncharacterized protein LOC109351162 isoform X2 n=1 Tax=Lupinus angustifolius TaxID=3871 RepID=UPI00092EF0AB|nr:PREDICTED: uncharacterized protein LOC109351162 isoform X2 [Lupinus angustifolius]